MNNVVRKVTPFLPGLERHFARIRFLRSLKVMSHLSETYIKCASADQLKAKRQQLIDGQNLLTDSDAKAYAFCDRLISALTARITAIPHERHLQSNIDPEKLPVPGFVTRA